MTSRQPRKRDPGHLAYIRSMPCAICGDTMTVEAAHLRLGSASNNKAPAGMGEKPSDKWCLPLCGRHHRQQHSMNEREFWASYNIRPVELAMSYWRPR